MNKDDPCFTDPTSTSDDPSDDQLLSIEEFLKQLDLELDQQSFEEEKQEEMGNFMTDINKEASETVSKNESPPEDEAGSNVPSSKNKEVSDNSQFELNAAVLSKVPIPVQPDPVSQIFLSMRMSERLFMFLNSCWCLHEKNTTKNNLHVFSAGHWRRNTSTKAKTLLYCM